MKVYLFYNFYILWEIFRYTLEIMESNWSTLSTLVTAVYFSYRGEAAKLAHLIESASLKRKYMTKNYEKIFI